MGRGRLPSHGEWGGEGGGGGQRGREPQKSLGTQGVFGQGNRRVGNLPFLPRELGKPLGTQGDFRGKRPADATRVPRHGRGGHPNPGAPVTRAASRKGGNAPSAPKARPGKVEEGGPVAKSLCAQRDFRAGKTRGGEFTVPTGDAWKTLCAIKDFFEEKRFWPPDP